MSIKKEKYIGESPLLGSPEKSLRLVIKDRSVGTSKIADYAITEEKLAPELLELLNDKNVDLQVDNKDATLAWGQWSTIATIGNVDIQVKLPEIGNYVPQSEYQSLLDRVAALEEQLKEPEEPEHTIPAYLLTTIQPTSSSVTGNVDVETTPPTEPIVLDRTAYTRQTDEYITYPKAWETSGHTAVITDSNGFTQGLSPMDEEEEYYNDLMVNGVTYVVRRAILNQGIYTLSFS